MNKEYAKLESLTRNDRKIYRGAVVTASLNVQQQFSRYVRPGSAELESDPFPKNSFEVRVSGLPNGHQAFGKGEHLALAITEADNQLRCIADQLEVERLRAVLAEVIERGIKC